MKIKSMISLMIFAIFVISCDLNTKFDNPYDRNSDAYIPDNDSDSDEKTDIDDFSDSDIADNDSTDTSPDQGDSAPDNDTETDSDDTDTETKLDEDTDTVTDTEPDEDEIPDEISDIDENPVDEDTDRTPELTEEEKCTTAGGNWSGSQCTRTQNCPAKPANSDWNGDSFYTQEYVSGEWTPSTVATIYSEEAGECHFKCVTGHHWWGMETGCTDKLTIGNICTGQNKCYNNTEEIVCPTSPSDDFYGQDAQYAALEKCTPQSFTLGTGEQTGTVFDNNTGLTWEQSPSENEYTWYTWDNAPNHCADLNTSNYGGKSNWRVPNPLEFMTIVDNSTNNPATNSNFTNMPTGTFSCLWTSKEYGGDTSKAFAFDTYYGLYNEENKTKTCKVLCVSGNELTAAASSDFTTQTISGSVVVTDSKTGLMWQKEYVSKTWQRALKYCEDLTYAGYSDWRLPNKNELASIINYEKSGAPYSYFPDMPDEAFRSSSTHVGYVGRTDGAWDFYFNAMNFSSKTNSINVRCVRNAGDTETDEETCAAEGGNWNGSQCTRTQNCLAKPANSEWNTDSSITQTWNGSSWSPSKTSSYNEAASTNECHFKCVTGYFWNSLACVVSPCNSNPCSSVENSTGICTATSAMNYSCGCNSGYYWWGIEAGCTDKKLTLGNICTGQTSCYDDSIAISMICPSSSSADFFGQDAQYAALGKCTPQSFSPGTGTLAGTVIDNNTGLIWEQSPSENTYTWDDAQNHCTDLNNSNYGGINTWRVPNPLEFMTIVDNSTYNPATNSNFTNMPTENSSYLWTSKEYNENNSTAYYFSPSYGWNSYNGTKTYTHKVLCVSGDEIQPATSANFTTQTISGEVVVSDSKTGLIWQKEYVTNKTWQQALKYCEDLTYAGYSDWRLPNKNELASLLNPGKSEAPYSNFPGMPAAESVWSSSTNVSHTSYTGYAWCVYFNNGYVNSINKTNDRNVRCVRTTLPECSTADVTPCYDSTSHLTWSKKSSSNMTYGDATSYCSGSEMNGYGGYTDWRLPTISELRTLIQNCSKTETGGSCGVIDSCLSRSDCRNDACSGCDYDSTAKYSKFGESGWFWSSSIRSDNSSRIWSVYFDYGRLDDGNAISSNFYVRCVR